MVTRLCCPVDKLVLVVEDFVLKYLTYHILNHRTLLKKLQCYKSHETCLKWFESYLTNKSRCVSLNSRLSESAHVTYGVPKGSIICILLIPLAFVPKGSIICILLIPLAFKLKSVAGDLYADVTISKIFKITLLTCCRNHDMT